MGNQSIFLTSNREVVGWILAVFATCGLAFPFLLIRAAYLFYKQIRIDV